MRLALLLISVLGLSSANATELSNSPLCKILPNSSMQQIYTKQLTEDENFNWWERQQVMAYINLDPTYDWGAENPSFNDIKYYFLRGDGRWDELHITLFQNQNNGIKYTYVHSYPGDNEYGAWMEWDGTVIATVEDGDLVVNGNYCP